MARTTFVRFSTFSLMALLALTTGVGCGADAKDKKIADLTAENEQLRRDIGDRDKQFSDCTQREEDARRAIDDLNSQLAMARSRPITPTPTPIVTNIPAKPTTNSDGWVTMPDFDMISIEGSVLFESGRADVRPQAKSTLDRLASTIRNRYSDRDIYVFGHTDNEPIKKSKWKDNWELGAARSLAVLRQLHTSGISYSNLVQANCGEYRPTVPNAGETGKKQNRRVEFYAVKRKAGGMARTDYND